MQSYIPVGMQYIPTGMYVNEFIPNGTKLSRHAQRRTSLQELQELGEWATFDMVLRYAHLSADHLKVAASRVQGTIMTQSSKPSGLRLVINH